MATYSSALHVERDLSPSVQIGQERNLVTHPAHLLIAYHKPCGMECTLAFGSALRHALPPEYHNVGRLDQHSHGLLLCSAHGRLTSALLSPRTAVPRIYRIVVLRTKDISNQQVCDCVREGVQTDYVGRRRMKQ
jgi:16S rRNA U516 pseudouridylate synthase RsuA-like enzyme